MGAVALRITSPVHGTTTTTGAVQLHAQVDQPPAIPLYYYWYSSLNVPADLTHTALNPTSTLDFPATLEVGTHVLTLSARDVDGDDPANVRLVTAGGVAGGPAGSPSPCVITVFKATLLAPASGATLSKADTTLTVRAPSAWARQDYQAINRVAYTFMFTGANHTVTPFAPTTLAFQDGPPPTLTYRGPLPAILPAGQYTLTLRAHDIDQPTGGESGPIPVTVTA
ncbi:hypothetical protein [Kutzneria sp. NPDC052558]|uniref:hypothetical protein n=1 Tax=Kutzneria sp. NPDC052558 TaxID=3364121 RepID=UPI0037C5E1BF